MKKMYKALLTYLAVAILLTLGGFSQTLFAAEAAETDNVNVTVNKRVFEEGKKPAEGSQQNTGELDDKFGGDPLANVEFTAYDITAMYHEKMATATGDIEAAQKTVIADIQQNYQSAVTTATSVQVTDGNGKAVFSGLPSVSNGLDAVYLFVETKTPNTPTITTIATPIVLAMPIYNLQGELNKDIHVYPKNETAENKKDIVNSNFGEVVVDGKKYYNVSTGDTINYQLTINVPSNITHEATTGYLIKDKPTAGLAYTGNLVVGNLVVEEDYTFKEVDGGFEINLNLASEKVKALAGSKLIITYDMKLTATIDPNSLLNNDASISINPGAETETETNMTPPTGLVTGGKKFIKVDAHNQNPLEGAEFIVKQNDKFAVFEQNTAGEYVNTKWVETEAEATRLVSGEDGTFSIKGMLNGTYQLIETKAPSDKYVKLPNAIDFKVEHGLFRKENIQAIKNTPKGLLPSTGGNGIYAFLIIGSGMMLAAFVWSKKHKGQVKAS